MESWLLDVKRMKIPRPKFSGKYPLEPPKDYSSEDLSKEEKRIAAALLTARNIVKATEDLRRDLQDKLLSLLEGELVLRTHSSDFPKAFVKDGSMQLIVGWSKPEVDLLCNNETSQSHSESFLDAYLEITISIKPNGHSCCMPVQFTENKKARDYKVRFWHSDCSKCLTELAECLG